MNRLRKAASSFFLLLTITSPVIVAGGGTAVITAITPQPAYAQNTTVADLPRSVAATTIGIAANIGTGTRIALYNIIQNFLETAAYNTAVLLASAGERQEPITPLYAIQETVILASDAAIGEFLNDIAKYSGWTDLNLCNLNEFDKLRINIILPNILADEPRPCTFTQIIGTNDGQGLQGAADGNSLDANGDGRISRQEASGAAFDSATLISDISNFLDAFEKNPEAFILVQAKFDDGDNALSAMLIAFDQAMGKELAAKEEAILERFGTSPKSIMSPISNRITTSSDQIQAQVWAQTFANYFQLFSYNSDDWKADWAAVSSVFTRTLLSKYIERLAAGMINTSFGIEDSLSGNLLSSTTGGRREALETYRSFQSGTYADGGAYDVLAEFAACPNEGAGATNCVVNSALQLAIVEGLTLSQAFEQGVLDPSFAFGVYDLSGSAILSPEQGLSLRNVQILRAYNVVPVGWELAATYTRDFAPEGKVYSLGEVVAGYDQCGEGENYSPFCGLVDPDWVLKEPLVYCRYEGYGSTILVEEFIDTDGQESTPQIQKIARTTSCLDTQTCIDEDDSGFCKAYGYCTEQRDIYRFQGTDCPLQYSSCESFLNEDRQQVNYLQNTINFNDCNDNNDGCKWYCSVYNTVDEAFQCAAENEIYTTCTDEGGCSCTGSDGVDCTVAEGGFTCTTDPDGDDSTDDGVSCTLGTEEESGTDLYSIDFDNDVQTCSDDDNGCTEFIQVNGGSNLLMNGDFESISYDGVDYAAPGSVDTGILQDHSVPTATDGYGDYQFAFTQDAGEGCDFSSSGVLDCLGWEMAGGAKALVRAVDSPFGFTSTAMQLQDGAGSTSEYIMHRFETKQALENRTFALSLYGRAYADDCTIDYWIGSDNGTGAAQTATGTLSFGTASENVTLLADALTFPDGVTDTILSLGFYMPNGCIATIDSVQLEENRASSAIAQYGSDSITLNVNKANSCSADEVGCELYTPQTGESDQPITGQITNPFSEACGDGLDYTNPSCSQCVSEKVGCDAFIEVPAEYNSPINNIALFTGSVDSIDEEVVTAAADRSGYYCSDDFVACNPSIGCGATVGSYTSPGSGSCLPSISVIPSTGEQCSAAEVGCEEYVNIDAANAGGEGLEYYSFLQRCVKPTERQNENGEIDTFFTWEGSDDTGYQLRSWDLKVSNFETDEDGDGNSAFGPCTNIDLWDYTGTAESAEATCVDDELGGVDDCSAVYGSDPSCVEFRDEDGNSFYRDIEKIIKADDQCTGYRNTKDSRLYYALPDDSTSCSASANQCREYKGSQGSNVQLIVDEDFETATFSEGGWEGGSASSETLTAGASVISMAIGSRTSSAHPDLTETARYDVSGNLDENDSYVVTFWAKSTILRTSSSLRQNMTVSIVSDDNATENSFGSTRLTTDWKQYTLGPIAFDEISLAGDEVLQFNYSGEIAFIDYVELRRSNSHYLIAGSAETCNGYEGCEEYSDSNSTTHYLKSFDKLCSGQAVGCEALIATNENASPQYATYNTENEYDQDDVAVAPDAVEFYTVTPGASCSAEVAGCMIAGEPDLDAYYDVEGFTQTYLVNNPDEYDTILCQNQSLYCEEFFTVDGETVNYFKNPGDRKCSYNNDLGYWVIDGTESEQCPIQYGQPTDEGAQPKGPICNGGARAGELCSHDNDCPAVDGDENTYRCSSDISDSSGWVGSCSPSYAGCTLYVDPNTRSLVDNQDFETNVYDNNNIGAEVADNLPDDWEILDENQSNPNAGSASVRLYRDIVDITIESGQTENDEPLLALGVANANAIGATGSIPYALSMLGSDIITTVDLDAANPSDPTAMVIYVVQGGGFHLTEDFVVNIESTVLPSTAFTTNTRVVIPAEMLNTLSSEVVVFYVTDTGAMYWADENQDGYSIEEWVEGVSVLSVEDAFQEVAATDPTTTVINGFYDAAGYTGTIDCDVFEQSTEHAANNNYSLKIGNNEPSFETCMIASTGYYEVDSGDWYTLRANVYTEDSNAEFSLGVHFYEFIQGTGYVEIGAYSDPKGYAFAAYEGGDRSDVTIPTGEWMHFHGTVGPNLTYEIPSNATLAVPFIEVKSGTIYVDGIRLSENQKYAYIEGTVDGDAQSRVNTCNGEIDAANGCVPFRDATFIGTTGDTAITSLGYLSTSEEVEAANGDLSVQSCVYGSLDDSEGCSSYPNAADTNVVLQVRRDRECAEWLTCSDGDTTFDEEGNVLSEYCIDIQRCSERNPDTGLCTKVVTELGESYLTKESDISVVSGPGNTDDIYKIQYLSGYSQIGIEWRGVEGDDGLCYYGAYEGLSSDLYDCTSPNITYGYYPYDWLTEQGIDTAAAITESVPSGTFEDVFCSGQPEYETLRDLPGIGLSNTDSLGPVYRGQNPYARCTFDFHCRNSDTDIGIDQLLTNIGSDISTSINEFPYHIGMCGNFDADGEYGDWEATGSTQAMIIDYQFGTDFSTGSEYAALNQFTLSDEDEVGQNYGAGSLDLNNVLLVDSEGSSQEGIEVEVSNVFPQGEYVVTFDASYASAKSINDYITVGFNHTNSLGAETTDYFTTGVPVIDIVLIIDSSTSMRDYILNIADGLVDFVGALEAGSDNPEATGGEYSYTYRYGIVTTGDRDGTYPLDFDDYVYNADPTRSTFGSVDNYGGSNGVSRFFTEDIEELDNVLQHIAYNLGTGVEKNYQAVADVVTGTIDLQDNAAVKGYEIPYANGSNQFSILVTDELPDEDDLYVLFGSGGNGWNGEEVENYFTDFLLERMSERNLSNTLFSILSPDLYGSAEYPAMDAYDDLTAALGGTVYDIFEEDYSDMLRYVATEITEQADPFSFSDVEYKSYTLGPITVEEKADAGDTTKLFIEQTGGSNGTPFVIDNVSLKPALEVNKEGNESQQLSANLLARECRGYPEEDSAACAYIEYDTGVVYQGWEGYCLLQDAWDQSRCVQWWPVDRIAGAVNAFANRQNEVRYTGDAPVLHCLVAKGNAQIGGCESVGGRCSTDAQCYFDSSVSYSCIGGETPDTVSDNTKATLQDPINSRNTINTSSPVSFPVTHTITSENYTINHKIDQLRIANSAQSHNDQTAANNFEEAGFWKFTGDAIVAEKQVHVSEIDNIHFTFGEPNINNTGNSEDEDYDQQLWKLRKENFESRDLEDSADTLFINNFTNLNFSATFDIEDPDTWPGVESESAPYYIALNGSQANERSLVQGWQHGWWCEDNRAGVCDPTEHDVEDIYNGEYTGVLATTFTQDFENIRNKNRVYNGGDPLNPFGDDDLVGAGSKIWTGLGGSDVGRVGTVFSSTALGVDSQAFTSNPEKAYKYFWSRHANTTTHDATSDNDRKEKHQCFGKDHCGANIIGFNFDFEDGYLDAVYLFIWDGIRRVDIQGIRDIEWTFELKEPCVFAIESVSTDGDIKPWMTRVASDSSYTVKDLGYTHTTYAFESTDSFSHYGSIIGDPLLKAGATLDELDGDGDVLGGGGPWLDFTAKSQNDLFQISTSRTSPSGQNPLPYSCIGNCTATACRADYDYEYRDSKDQDTNGDGYSWCEEKSAGLAAHVGVYGLCVDSATGEYPPQGATLCGHDDDSYTCPTGYECQEISNLDNAYSYAAVGTTSWENGLLKSAVEEAWERYKYIYADVPSGAKVYYSAAQGINEPAPTYTQETATASSLTWLSDLLNDFEQMDECSGTDGARRFDNDYCGVRPKISNIRMNGKDPSESVIEIDGPAEAVLSFDMEADPDQEPLTTIKISWESLYDESIGEFEHSFTEAIDREDRSSTTRDWNAEAATNVNFTHLYNCDFDHYEGDSKKNSDRIDSCLYRVRVQVEDSWGWCSGDQEVAVTDLETDSNVRGFNGNNGTKCESYDALEATVLVSP